MFTRNVGRLHNVSDLTKGAATGAATDVVIGGIWASGLVDFRYDLNGRDLA